MSKELLDTDLMTGISTYHDYDHDTDTTFITTEQDIQSILDDNKESRNHGLDKKGEFWKAASVPIVVQMEWLTKYGIDMMNPDHIGGVKRLLNSSDYAYLRTNEFKL